jgi:FtsP/CotA-like multicopper oxidase with cupredoxin domain
MADVSAPLPQLDLQPGSTVTVTVDAAGAVITSLVIHGWQEAPDAVPELDPVKGAYLPGPPAV